jgi:hypothetical protein
MTYFSSTEFIDILAKDIVGAYTTALMRPDDILIGNHVRFSP